MSAHRVRARVFDRMPQFLIYHRHEASECSPAYAAWKGFDSSLRGSSAKSSCRWGGHEIWWDLEAVDEQDALGCLPHYLAERASATRVGMVDIP